VNEIEKDSYSEFGSGAGGRRMKRGGMSRGEKEGRGEVGVGRGGSRER